MSRINYILLNLLEANRFKDGFIGAYKEAFGSYPYNEVYTDKQIIDDVLTPHLDHGIIFLALDGDSVIGFGCAKPIGLAEEDVQGFLQTRILAGVFPDKLHNLWYMSEVGVLIKYRKQGIGLQLIMHRLSYILQQDAMNHRLKEDSYYVMRTAAKNSNLIKSYRLISAIEVSGLHNVSELDQVQVNKSQSTERIYLYGSCGEAIKKIAKILYDSTK